MVAITTSEKFFLNKNNELAYSIISKIFKELVNASMILIFVSGIIMTIQRLSDVQASLGYGIILIIKIMIRRWILKLPSNIKILISGKYKIPKAIKKTPKTAVINLL